MPEMKVASSTAKILQNVPLPDEVAVMHTKAAVLDLGAYSTRLGFAGDNAPRMNERTVVSAHAVGSVRNGSGGDEVAAACFNRAYDSPAALGGDTSLVHVLRDGVVTDWQACETLLSRVDDILQLSNTDLATPLLMTEKALVPAAQRRKMAELLFETHGLSALSFHLSPVLALYASGLCTGVSVELGEDQCHVAPVFQGFPLLHAIHSLGLGGRDQTDLFATLSAAVLPSTVLPHRRRDVWRYMKERYAQLLPSAEHYAAVMQARVPPRGANATDGARITTTHDAAAADGDERHERGTGVVRHVLPDGTTLSIDAERFTVAEVLFNPGLLPRMLELPDQSTITQEVQLRTTVNPCGVHQLIVDAVRRCDADLRPYFHDHIVLSGGSSLFAGLPARLESEVQAALPPSAEPVRVEAGVERREAAFVGGSILASLPSFQELWVSRAEYQEVGSMAVVQNCY